MTWKDRIKQAAYTSPFGIRSTFDFEDVELSFDKNTSIYRFPRKDGASIPCLSHGEYHYPMICYISGKDYDIFSAIFEKSLKQNGNGILEHPVYGIKTVQVLSVKRNDALATAANQAVFSIDFAESSDEIFPSGILDTIQFIDKQIDFFLSLSSTNYSQTENYTNPIEQLNSQARWQSYLNIIYKFLQPVSISNAESNKQFQIIFNSINNNLSSLINDPVTLSSQFILLIESVSIVGELSLLFTAYFELSAIIINASNINSISNDSRNQVIEASVILMTIIISLCKSTLYSQYNSKADALNICNLIIYFSEYIINIIEEREQLFEENSLEILLYGDYNLSSNLNNVIQWTSSNLSNIAFGLPQERHIILQSERTIIDLSYELYQSSSNEFLDKLINTNNLENDDILLLPVGKDIVYYV